MSFPKGPRFEPQKKSEVPGPNAYDLNQPSQLDAYKRGAFLEKAERFAKEAASDAPGPGAYSSNSKPPPPDRYAILQRKVEDLERIHHEGKKAHQAEVERLRLDLFRSQNAVADFEKQMKKTVLLESRVQELKKVSSTEQAELRELRVKLKASEHERAQLFSKHGEVGDLKGALQSLRDEVREKDRLIADLQKAVAAEREKRELEKAESQQVQSQLQEETRQQHSLIDQLEQHRQLLTRASEEYGRLVQKTVLASVHSQLKHEHGLSLMRTWRLERKLANSEGQITELVNLIRHAKDTNAVLARQVDDLREECGFYAAQVTLSQEPPQLAPLYSDLCAAVHDSNETRRVLHETDRSLLELYHLTCRDLADAHLGACLEREQQRLALQDAQSRRDALETESAKLRQDRDAVIQRLDEAVASLARAERDNLEYEQKIQAAANDRNTLQQLTETVKRNRMTEDGLRAEIQLADSEQFQSAYYSLSDEVNALIARNELAEVEAQHLSKFNAEILGHHNPAQRIMYVDRIRRELAESKQKYTVTAVELETSTARNTELLRELDMYKSASVPLENKPRTVITRVARPPLAVLNKSVEDFSYAM
ncbi:hypothetical protein FB45DRAFT_734139 [Roridomyces roridus]|uniref:Uncharacterized protein n=1 Tax=Roridomyces roridus TaxID=1738132 RepID=A0AAD7FZB7_9AGAR|nr:hypothetical protein FB45DRAFT_734139 [Roridomyces roridus]